MQKKVLFSSAGYIHHVSLSIKRTILQLVLFYNITLSSKYKTLNHSDSFIKTGWSGHQFTLMYHRKRLHCFERALPTIWLDRNFQNVCFNSFELLTIKLFVRMTNHPCRCLEPRQHLPSVFSFHFRFHKGKSNFGSIKKRTAQKRNEKLRDHGMVIFKMHLTDWNGGIYKKVIHVISRQTNVSSVWSDFDNLLYLLLPTKVAWPQL